MIALSSILLVFAFIFKFFPPKNMNSIYGYRTTKSRENKTNWKVANEYFANLMVVFMAPLFLASLMFYFFNVEYTIVLN